MTEEQWLKSAAPGELLDYALTLRRCHGCGLIAPLGKDVQEAHHFAPTCSDCGVTGRRPRLLRFSRWRLLLVAMGRRSWYGGITRGEHCRAVEAGERFADGQCSVSEMADAWGAADAANRPGAGGHTHATLLMTCCAANDYQLYNARSWLPEATTRYAELVRDIVGNPFRPEREAPWSHTCKTSGTVYPVALADHLSPQVAMLFRLAYSERDSVLGHLRKDNLLPLADALEEAGLSDRDCPVCSGQGQSYQPDFGPLDPTHAGCGGELRERRDSPGCRPPKRWCERCLAVVSPSESGVLSSCLVCSGTGRLGRLAHLRGPGPHVRGCWALEPLPRLVGFSESRS